MPENVIPTARPAKIKAAPARRSQAERSDQTISTLRTVALELLLNGGVVSLNLAELGDRAGYSRGIVHYHFGSKEELLTDLLQSTIEASVHPFANVTAKGMDGVLGIIDAVETAARERPHDSLARTVLLNEAAASASEKLRRLGNYYNQRARSAFERQIREDADFARTGLSPSVHATLILSAVRGIHEQWLAERDSFDACGALRALKSLIQSTRPAYSDQADQQAREGGLLRR